MNEIKACFRICLFIYSFITWLDIHRHIKGSRKTTFYQSNGGNKWSVFVFQPGSSDPDNISRRSSLGCGRRINGAVRVLPREPRLRGSAELFCPSSLTMSENLLMESKPNKMPACLETGKVEAPIEGKLSMVVIVQSHRARERPRCRDAGGSFLGGFFPAGVWLQSW